MTHMTPAEAGRRIASEHAATHPLQPWQIEEAARILAAAIREKHAKETAQLMTATEVAERLRVRPDWVRRAALRGDISSRKIGRKRMFTEDDVLEYLERVKSYAYDPMARPARSRVERELRSKMRNGNVLASRDPMARSPQSEAALRREARKRGER